MTIDNNVLRKNRSFDFQETSIVKKTPHLSQQGGACLQHFNRSGGAEAGRIHFTLVANSLDVIASPRIDLDNVADLDETGS